jgi:small redox-active disulfide protein 2
MKIKILGPGCRNCVTLEEVTRQVVDELGVEAELEKVTDYGAIAGYGVLRTPGLVVDEQVVLSGRVPTARHVRELLEPLVGGAPG